MRFLIGEIVMNSFSSQNFVVSRDRNRRNVRLGHGQHEWKVYCVVVVQIVGRLHINQGVVWDLNADLLIKQGVLQ